MRPAIVSILGVLLLGAPHSAGETEYGEIAVRVFTAFGEPLDAYDLEIFRLCDEKVLRKTSASESRRTLSLPYADYSVRAWSKGFSTSSTLISLRQPYVLMPIALSVGSLIGSKAEPAASLSGVVLSARNVEQSWVKLVSLYSHYVTHTTIDKSGRFRIERVPPGKYMLLTFVRNETHDQREVRLPIGEQTVQVP